MSLQCDSQLCVTGLMKNMQPDPGFNRGPSSYRENALPTELSELPTLYHIIHQYLYIPKSLPLHYFPLFLLRFDGEGVESHSFQTRTCSAAGGHGTKL